MRLAGDHRLWTAVLVLPFAALFLFTVISGVPDISRSGDGALLEFSTRSTARLETLTGPYSRYGFHHPGPAYFLARIPLYYIFGRRATADYLTVCLISILSILACVRILRRSRARTGAAAFCLLSALYLWTLRPAIWLSDWNPFIIILPSMVAFLSMAAAASGGVSFLPLAAVSVSFTVQTHAGSLPAMLLAALYTSAALYRRRGETPMRKPLILGAAAAGLMWAPVLAAELLPGRGGNLLAMAGFLGRTSPDISPGAALAVWADAVSGIEGHLLPGHALRTSGILLEAKAFLVLLRTALLVVCLRTLHRRGERGFPRSLLHIVLLVHLATLASVLQLRGEPHAYLFLWFSALSPLSWTAILLVMARSRRLTGSRRVRTAAVCAAALCILCLSFLNTRAIWRQSRGRPWDPLGLHDPLVAEVAGSISGDAAAAGGVPLEIVPASHDQWPLMAGVVNQLDKMGMEVSVSRDLDFMTGLPPAEGSLEMVIDGSTADRN